MKPKLRSKIFEYYPSRKVCFRRKIDLKHLQQLFVTLFFNLVVEDLWICLFTFMRKKYLDHSKQFIHSYIYVYPMHLKIVVFEQ